MARVKAAAAEAGHRRRFDGEAQLLLRLLYFFLHAQLCATSCRHRPREKRRYRTTREDENGEMAGYRKTESMENEKKQRQSLFFPLRRRGLSWTSPPSFFSNLCSLNLFASFLPASPAPPPPPPRNATLNRTRSSPPTPSTASPSPRTATSPSSASSATSVGGGSSRCATTAGTPGGSWPGSSRSRWSTTRCASRPACTSLCELLWLVSVVVVFFSSFCFFHFLLPSHSGPRLTTTSTTPAK